LSVFVRLSFFLSLYCLYFNVWLLITPLVSSNGDQYRSTGRKPPTCH
jgi:hypothetical protein